MGPTQSTSTDNDGVEDAQDVDGADVADNDDQGDDNDDQGDDNDDQGELEDD